MRSSREKSQESQTGNSFFEPFMHSRGYSKIEVSAVENKVLKYYRKCQNGTRLMGNTDLQPRKGSGLPGFRPRQPYIIELPSAPG
jgi:hypothetical protein